MSFIANGLIEFEEYAIDRARWQLSWRSEPLPLNRKTFDLLLYLIDHRERVVGKEELLQALWPEQFIEESNLTQHVFLLRKALSRHDSGLKIIETVPGRGYRFTAPVMEPASVSRQLTIGASESITRITIEEEQEDAEVQSLAERNQSRNVSGGSSRRVLLVAASTATVIALAAAGWFGWQQWLNRTGGKPVDVVIAPISGSTGDAVLDQALVVALRMDLSQSPFVSVVSDARVRATLTEMKQNPDAGMAPAIAREVCERTNSQAVLHGSVARLGQHFLLTEDATSCVNGTVLAEAKYEASRAEDLPHSIDRLAETLRRKLGESRRSIARFDVPLSSGNTASLEALKDFTQGEIQSNQGKYVDAIGLMKKAIAADPNFPDAYYDLAAYYRSVLDLHAERDSILKAYSLRDSASEPIRLAIIALYHSSATQDLYETERNYRNWTELYPRSAQAWNGLSVVDRYLGRHSEALVAAQRALELRPAAVGLYTNLAYEQITLGDPRAALATCDRALAKGLDGDYIREHCFQAAYALHDAARVQTERDWTTAHPEAIYVRFDEIDIAIAEGRFSDALRLTPQLNTIMRQRGLTGPADDFIRETGINLIEAGEVAGGTQLLRSVPADPKGDTGVLALVRAGDFAAAENAVHAMQAEFPQGTLWNDYRGPQVQAIIALATHKPKEAISTLERVRPLEGRDPVISMLRGNAYLAVGEPALAESSYRKVLEGPGQVPEAPEIPLSWLGLGRALAAQGKRPAAVEGYKHFFTLWAHADPDAMYLKQARQEFAALQTVPSAK